MFNNYRVVNNVLYLYVDDKCEIGSLFNNDNSNDIITKIKNYIHNHKIQFNGVKVVLLLSGLMLGTIYLNNVKPKNYDVYSDNKYVYNIVDKSIPDIAVEEKITEILDEILPEKDNNKEKNNVINEESKVKEKIAPKEFINNNSVVSDLSLPETNEKIITVRRTNAEVLQINLEDYLIGVVAAEMPASFNSEALKAQAVIARTYTLKLLENKRTITDDVSTQVYKSNDELAKTWGSNYNTYYAKIKKAVLDTKNLCIKYDGTLIDAVYHSTSNGYTQDSLNVWGNSFPYLKSVNSLWDTSASTYLRSTTISFDKISSALKIDFNEDSLIEIISKDESGRISKIRFKDKEITGVEARNLLGLRSADFDIFISSDGVIFTTRGYGHGVGMSQYGANAMANLGYSFEQILKHYYTGVEIVKENNA